MKILATMYAVALGAAASWAWGVYVLYEGTTEHNLPAMVLGMLTLPSSLLLERVVQQVPWLMSSPMTVLSILSGLGGIQAALVWLIATRLKHRAA